MRLIIKSSGVPLLIAKLMPSFRRNDFNALGQRVLVLGGFDPGKNGEWTDKALLLGTPDPASGSTPCVIIFLKRHRILEFSPRTMLNLGYSPAKY
jgi:hypothetical protein